LFFRHLIALFIANNEALKIFILSISIDETEAIEYSIDLSLIIFKIFLLLISFNFLESFRLSILVFGGNITADAITGPAKAPLPTSSTPAIKILFSLKKFSLMV
tara:strand:- start:375 stop:686 length:312 start_codon:yes stop_codon:yes gene_type:complete